jgi:aspartyl/asparaginyl beta-hydroxylase (cupin superfamily)
MSLDRFPVLQELAKHWPTMREEGLGVDVADVLDVSREDKPHEQVVEELRRAGRAAWCRGWGVPDKWLNLGLVAHDAPIPHVQARCPKTLALFERIRGVKVAAFSLFFPGALLPAHSHPELAQEGLLTFHLGLEMAPDFNYLYVDGQFIREETGKAFVFDGSKTHFAFNTSESPRLILYVEFSPDRLRVE